jgi:hypothetical protein
VYIICNLASVLKGRLTRTTDAAHGVSPTEEAFNPPDQRALTAFLAWLDSPVCQWVLLYILAGYPGFRVPRTSGLPTRKKDPTMKPFLNHGGGRLPVGRDTQALTSSPQAGSYSYTTHTATEAEARRRCARGSLVHPGGPGGPRGVQWPLSIDLILISCQ